MSEPVEGTPGEHIRLSPEQAYRSLESHPGCTVEHARIYRDYR